MAYYCRSKRCQCIISDRQPWSNQALLLGRLWPIHHFGVAGNMIPNECHSSSFGEMINFADFTILHVRVWMHICVYVCLYMYICRYVRTRMFMYVCMYTGTYGGAVITESISSKNPHSGHPMARPLVRDKGTILPVQTLIDVTPKSLQQCECYHVILNCDVTGIGLHVLYCRQFNAQMISMLYNCFSKGRQLSRVTGYLLVCSVSCILNLSHHTFP